MSVFILNINGTEEHGMEKKSVIEVVREVAHEWVNQASVAELVTALPDKVLGENRGGFVDRPSDMMALTKPATRVPTKLRHRVGPAESQEIRSLLKGFEPNTPDYERVKRDICCRLWLTGKQVGAVFSAMRKGDGKQSETVAAVAGASS